MPARNLRTLLLTHQGRLVDASNESLQTMRLLGVEMPDPTDKAALGQAIGAEFGAYQAGLAGRSIESCFQTNPRAGKAAVFAGWREMDQYMRDNNVVGMPSEGEAAPAEKASSDKPTS